VGGVVAAALVAAGVYAWREVRVARAHAADLAQHLDKQAADLEACTKGSAADRDARENAEKVASSSAADLNASRAELDELRAERADTEKRLAAFRAFTDKFRKMIDSGKLQVVMKHGRMTVKLPAGVLFASGSADLSKEGKLSLAEVAAVLKQFPDRRFMVAGHTDNVPVVQPSPFKNNLELSTARALTVAGHLVSSGMNAGHLVAAGYAEFEPVRENSTEAGRQENRRIEIVLMPNLAELPTVPIDADGGAPAPKSPAAASASSSAAASASARAGK
jgi:chemotaxis protein MotB